MRLTEKQKRLLFAKWRILSKEQKLSLYEKAGHERKYADNPFSLQTLPLRQMNPAMKRKVMHDMIRRNWI